MTKVRVIKAWIPIGPDGHTYGPGEVVDVENPVELQDLLKKHFVELVSEPPSTSE
jgi:hypothetical protein